MIKMKYHPNSAGVEITFDGDNGPESFIMIDGETSLQSDLDGFKGLHSFPGGVRAAFQTVHNMKVVREMQAWSAKQAETQ